MVEKHNYYENRLYTSTGAGETAGSNAIPDWKQPLNFLRWLVQFVKNPASAAGQLAAGDNIQTSLILVAINLISVLTAGIICVIIMNIRYRLYFSWVNVSLSGIIIIGLLLALFFDFGFSGLLFVSTNIIFKEKAMFSKMLALTGGKIVTDSLFLLAGSLFMLLGNFFFFISVAAGNIISITTLIYVYNEESSLQTNKKIYSISGALVVTYTIIMVIIKAVMPLLMSLS